MSATAAEQPPAQAVERVTRARSRLDVLVREAEKRDMPETVHIFWDAFSTIFPFHETEPLALRPSDPAIRLRRTVHRQEAVLSDPGFLFLVAEDETTGEVLGWAGYVRPGASGRPHPWITEDEALRTDEDREAWEGVDREHFNGLWKGWDEYRWKVLGDRDHWLLAPLCVKPSAQGRGVGTALLSHVARIVDSTPPHLPIYLDASEAGQPVYLKAGYEYFGEEGRPFPGMVRWGKGERPDVGPGRTDGDGSA